MKNSTTFILFMAFFHLANAQTESVHLHFDKIVAYPGDTCWFTGYIFDNNYPSNFSKNLYVELYDESNNLSLRKVFPIANGISIGQLELPKRSGLFWVRAYTRNSSYFFQSVSIRSLDNTVIVRNMLDYKESPATTEIPGLLINSVYTNKGISCTIFTDSDNKYIGKQLDLVLTYYNTKIGEYSFTLNKNRQRNILIPRNCFDSHFHGYVSFLFYNTDTLVAKQDLLIPQREIPAELLRDTGGGYIFRIKDNTDWIYSVSVGCSSVEYKSASIWHCLSPSGVRIATDTSYLTYQGTVNSTVGKGELIKNKDMVIMFGKDSFNNIKLIPIDHSGKLFFSGLYFFDTSYLNYMLNGYTGDKLSEVKITMSPQIYPKFIAPDSGDYELDTFENRFSLSLPNLDTVKYLKTILVEASHKRALDHLYTSGRFSWPAHFSFDLVKENNKYNYAISDYLNLKLPWFLWSPIPGKPPTFKNKPVIIYVNEQLVNWRQLFMLHINELAYVKVLEDFVPDDRFTRMISEIGSDILPTVNKPDGLDMAPSAMICIYTRKDKDLRYVLGNMNRVLIKGYNRSLTWNNCDRTTFLWMPHVSSNEFRFNTVGLNIGSLKIIVEGVNEVGEVFHFENDLN